MKRHFPILCFVVIVFSSVSLYADVYRQIRIPYPDEATFLKIVAAGIEPISGKPGEYLDFALDDEDLAIFVSLNVPFTVIHDDMTAYYQSRNPLGLTMGGYRTYAEMVAVMDSFASNYPDLCTPKFNIATSEQGRALWTMKVSDNPSVNEDEPKAFVNGLHHAREPIGGEITLEFMRFLLTQYGTDPVATNLVDNYQLYFCPVSNPDGYEYNRQIAPNGGGMWRKNRRNNWDGNYGVDLNRNYSYFWGYDDNGSSPSTSSEVYRGPTPSSEPEVLGLQNFETAQDFAIVVNYHAYGDLFLYPWGYYNGVAEDVSFYDSLGAYANSQGYTVGTPWQTLYSTNGDSNDWGYGQDRYRRRSFSIVIEVGNDFDGFWPDQSRIAPLVNQNINILKDLLPRAYQTYKRRLPAMPTVTSPSVALPGSQFYLQWQHSNADTFNLPVSFRVIDKADYSGATQTFETTAGYTTDGFSRSGARVHNGVYSIYSGQGNNQRKNVTINERLKVQPGDSLTFWAWYNIQTNYDYAYVQISTDEGQVWYELNGNLSTSNDPNRHNKGYGITGSSSGNWVRGVYPLSSYVGQEIKIRFAYWTDGSVANEGIYIDDIYPLDNFGSMTVLEESVTPESLLVGPYSVGFRWFQVEARDDLGHLSGPSLRFQVEIQGNTYSLSGQVNLSDSPPDLSGSIVSILGTGQSDTTDASGDYYLPTVPEGTYDIAASHLGYYPDTVYAFSISSDSTLSFALALAPPASPVLISPPDMAILDTAFIAFDWNDVAFATRYIVEIATDVDFANVIIFDSSLTVSNYVNALPLANDEYFWRVTAFNQAGFSQRSPAWGFTVDVTLAAPILTAPPDGYISSQAYIHFDWTDVFDTITYIFEFALDRQFANMVIVDSSISVSQYINSDSLPNAEYYWRVRATDGVYWSPYSETWAVFVDVNSGFIPGDANGSGVLNGVDVVYLVNYLKGGPAPVPLLAGDANGNCEVNGVDVTYLVNYFKGFGPPPIQGDCLAGVNIVRRPAEK